MKQLIESPKKIRQQKKPIIKASSPPPLEEDIEKTMIKSITKDAKFNPNERKTYFPNLFILSNV